MAKERAGIYLRQSTYREESISLELQETACREYARRHGYRIVGVEADPGVSGRTFNRPGVKAVMDQVARGEIDVIILWKWSRLSRNRLDWYVAADKAQQAGGRIESATEPIDTSTSIGRLSRGMMIEIAAFESERAGDQWREAQERRIRHGLPHSGKPRFGYIYDVDQKAYVVNPETGPILADLYARYIAGEAFSALTSWLAQNRIPTAMGRTWAAHTVKRCLDTGFAAGIIRYKGDTYPGAHPRLIGDATWAAYQQTRDRRRQRPRAERSTYLLSGLVRCKTCDLALTGWTHSYKDTVYYRCERSILTKAHPTHHARADHVERVVREFVESVAEEAQALMKVDEGPHATVDLSALQADVDRRRKALATLTVRHVEGAVTEEAYAAASPTLQERLTHAEEALRSATAAPVMPAVAADTAVRLLEDWDVMPVSARREGLRALVDRVEVDFPGGKTVQVIPRAGLLNR